MDTFVLPQPPPAILNQRSGERDCPAVVSGNQKNSTQRKENAMPCHFSRVSLSREGEEVEDDSAAALVASSMEKYVSSSQSSILSFLDDDEWRCVLEIHTAASKMMVDKNTNGNDHKDSDGKNAENKSTSFQSTAENLFPDLSPGLIMKLKSGEALVPTSMSNDSCTEGDMLLLNKFLDLSKALNAMTDRSFEDARNILEKMLNAGEIKKLDALIGQSAKEQKLDVAFFQVLQMNLRDAANDQSYEDATKAAKIDDKKDSINHQSASMFQILQHIYTRCQEEVEKVINPGTALLNKLLRTDVDSIRNNQLNHYLCHAPNTIRSPNGKKIKLKSNNRPLVSHGDFCNSIASAVQQIRTMKKTGMIDSKMAANLVESIRQVAKEARIVIGEHYGRDSSELLSYEDSLEPVFRPKSPDSPYIKGIVNE